MWSQISYPTFTDDAAANPDLPLKSDANGKLLLRQLEVSGDGVLALLQGATSARFDLMDNDSATGERRFAFSVNSEALNISLRGDTGSYSSVFLNFYANSGNPYVYSAVPVSVGTGSSQAQLHVKQPSTSGAKPVLKLEQPDVSEQFIDFVSTIGTGNAIEAVGGKTLTTTHFIKVTLPGGLTRYMPVGTIA